MPMQRALTSFSRRVLSAAVVWAFFFLAVDTVWAAKNIILMVADGAGFNTWIAADMYEGRLGKQVYDQPGWTRLACSTYPLNLSHKPTGDLAQDPSLVYDPAKAWSDSTTARGERFAGYVYLKKTATDSAAAATALATGQKTFNNAINWTNDDRPMRGQTIAEIAKSRGKSVGVITTVPWSHATPAALGGAHNPSRNNFAAIANEMLDAPYLDVIMGAGHPDYDNDGRPLRDGDKREYKYVGGRETWDALKHGRRGAWKLIESREDFERLAEGPTPAKTLGTARAADTLQEKRGRGRAALPYDQIIAKLTSDAKTPAPFAFPLNSNVPSLAAMARAALNCLDDNPQGFYLMIEGGAVDWANHANEPERMIEEQIDFLRAVEAVTAWIEKNSNWDDTLLILTADHECGLVWGPKSDVRAFDRLVDNGKGRLPGLKHLGYGHSNSLVPLYACGAGSEQLLNRIRGTDAKAAAAWGSFAGRYVENIDIFAVMKAEAMR